MPTDTGMVHGISKMLVAKLKALENQNRSVEKYQGHFSWLRDAKFLQDLENDSVDSDIIEEELSALQEEEVPSSKRQKVAKFLQSNPVQILLFIVVLLDAGIVIAQLILDLNSVKARMHKREDQISQLVYHIEKSHPGDLCGYNGTDVNYILELLHETDPCARIAKDYAARNLTISQNSADNQNRTSVIQDGHLSANSTTGVQKMSNNPDSNIVAMETMPRAKDTESASDNRESYRTLTDAKTTEQTGSSQNATHRHRLHRRGTRGYSHHEAVATVKCTEENVCHRKIQFHEDHDTLREIAHGLHFASIAFLAFLVVEDLVKIAAMGKDFFRHKVDVLDAIIIISSFIMDIVFLNGMSGEEGQKAVAVLVVLLLWRIARVTDGIMITVKQRQEFRIRLQKRARRNAERKIDALEEERHVRVRQIHSLKELCSKAGVREEEVEACAPRRGPRRVSTTMCALSSVARLSVSMTMSMSSGLFSMIDDDPYAEKNQLDKNFNSAVRREIMALPDGGFSPKWTRRKSDGNLYFSPKAMRRKAHNSGQATGNCTGGKTRHKSGDGHSPKVKKKKKQAANGGNVGKSTPVSSPVNSSGVKIVINQGSESESSTICDEDAPSEGVSDSFLRVEAANALSEDKKMTNMSQVFLLSEIR